MRCIKFERKVALDGFTLIEILVVITIIAVVATVSVFSVNPISHRTPNLAKQAEMVFQLASFAGQEARSQRKLVTVNVDLQNNIISTDGIKQNEIVLPKTTNMSLTTGQEMVLNEKNGSIVFFASGGTTGGEITLSSIQGNIMPQTIKIHWLTGSVSTSDVVDENNISQ